MARPSKIGVMVENTMLRKKVRAYRVRYIIIAIAGFALAAWGSISLILSRMGS